MMREGNPDEFIQKALKVMLPEIKEVFGSELLMVSLYGSAATGTFIKGVSDINLLIIVERSDAKRLCMLSKRSRRSLLEYRITPHILTRQELVTSADVFPVEYTEIRETMILLEGDSLFEDLDSSMKNYRHQVESMIRGSLNSLRQILLMTSCEEKILYRELLSWSGRQIPLYRAVLRLFGSSPEGMSTEQMLQVLEKNSGCPCEGLKELANLRGRQTEKHQLHELSSKLLDEYMGLVEVIDAIKAEK